MRRGLLLLAGALLVLASAGAAYQDYSARADAQRSPEPGRRVNVDGVYYQLNCTGSGSPTVILESGLGDVLVEWKAVQPEIQKTSRVCSYDRAGYGGSDPGPFPRTSLQEAQELNALLHSAGEHPPYVLAAHSYGGYIARLFRSSYPADVVGMVLIDTTQEDQYSLLPQAWSRLFDTTLQRYQSQAFWAPLMMNFGLTRIRLEWAAPLDPNFYLILQTKYLRARASELENIKLSAELVRASGTLGDLPLLVLTGAKADEVLHRSLNAADDAEYQRLWIDDLQPRLARLSTKGERILLIDSGHDVPNDRPDAIISAIEKVRRMAGGN